MHITDLEIDNFKSFGKKTKIPFYEGFTVISGPNGSGKSNIIDSILFVLSLSGSRGLRAERLTDLINLNSGKNTAEVAITFSDGTKIRRRIKKTQSGYYNYLYLNDMPCRQGDLLDFLAGCGIIPHGYNVVMQGDINRIIEMSDFERRKIIDEIAGVAEFDSKKTLANEELQVVREKIDLEMALLDEHKNILSQLGKERESALLYRSLKDTLKELMKCQLAVDFDDRCRKIGDFESEINKEQEQFDKLVSCILDSEKKRSSLREEISGIDQLIQDKSDSDYMEMLASVADAKASINHAEKSSEKLVLKKESNLKRIGDLFTDIKRYEGKIETISVRLRDLMIDRTNLSMALSVVNSELSTLEAELEETSKEHEDDEASLLALEKSIKEKKDLRSDLLHRQDLLIEKSRMRTSEKERLEAKVTFIEGEIRDKENVLADMSDKLEKMNFEKRTADADIGALDKEFYEKREYFEDIHKKVRETRIKADKLEAQQNAQGRHGKAIDAVLRMEGVYGTIAELGRCQPEYAVALNIAAGGKLHFVVVENDQVALDAINYLKDHRLGRVTFLPLNKMRPRFNQQISDPDIIGYAVDLIDCDPVFEDVFRVVFGSTVVVESSEAARKKVGRFRMVTPDGTLFEMSGSMTGGSIRKDIKGFGAATADELKNLNLKLSGLLEEESRVGACVEGLSLKREALNQDRVAIEQEIAKIQISCNGLSEQVLGHKDELALVRLELDGYCSVAGKAAKELEEAETQIEILNREIKDFDADVIKITERIEGTGITELHNEIMIRLKQVEESERRLKNKDSDISDAQMELQFNQNCFDDKQAQKEQIQQENLEIDLEYKGYIQEIEDKRAEILELEDKQREFSKEIKELKENRDSLVSETELVDRKVVDLSGKKEVFIVRLSSLQEDLDSLKQEVDKIEVELDGFKSNLSAEEVKKGIETVNLKVSEIGDVNMLAVEEYERVNARVLEREEKLGVLEQELKSIQDRIEHFSKMKYEAFMEVYAGISANFRDIFSRLARGSGELVLGNSEDPFSGGLSFAVQPGDKKVHLLSALSGGEKSLTTLAFIFSIQKHIPAPFYAFDEVDMNLDGSNVEQIADMINKLSKNSQFVNISLRKPMIDAANRIIGVTVRPDKSTLVTGVALND